MEAMLFGPSATCEAPAMDLGFLLPYVKPLVTNLDFSVDSDIKLGKHLNLAVKSFDQSFYHLRLL